VKFEPKKIAMGLGAAFLALTVWTRPGESGESAGNFLSDTFSWFGDAFDKVTEFSENVVEDEE
jgi:hypothetical protein